MNIHGCSLSRATDFKYMKGSDGKRVYKQKRLLLLNLNELYINYKAKYQDNKIGLSKLCSLQSQHCITIGCRWTHSVCVCTIHQTVKLMISALPTDTSLIYHDLMAKLVCSVDSNLCMIHRCSRCPGANELSTCLECLCEVSVMQLMKRCTTNSGQITPHCRTLACHCTSSWKLL